MIALLASLGASVVPIALGGETAAEAGGNGTAIAVVSVVSIVGAYLLLFVLWRYVFSAKAKARRGEPPD
jgi:cation transporter-like permease